MEAYGSDVLFVIHSDTLVSAHAMRAEVKRAEQYYSRLVSPWFNITRTSCLEVQYRLSVDEVRLWATICHDGDHTSCPRKEFPFVVQEINLMRLDIADVDSYRVTFEANVTGQGTSSKREAVIYSIMLKNGPCIDLGKTGTLVFVF